MKIAVSAYSFLQALRNGRIQLPDILPKAKELGYDGVEIVRWGDTVQDMLKLAKQLKGIADSEGIPISAYVTGADFLKNNLEKQVDILKQEVEVAQILGTNLMRHDSTAGWDTTGKQFTLDEALPIVSEGYRRVTEYAFGCGVTTMIENHGHFFQHSARVKRLIDTVDHINFRWLVDIGNFMCVDQNSIEAVQTAAPYAAYVHAKDFHFKAKGDYIPPQGWFPTAGGNYLRGGIIGHGVVNVKECLRTLKKAGYNGWLSVEFEGIEDCFTALKYDLINLNAILKDIE